MKGIDKYKDIINLPHHQSNTRSRMSNYDRAAQFAPFAALKGYEEEIDEAIRTTESKIELSDEQLNQLNEKLNELKQIIKQQPTITVIYFVQDERKSGGKYITIEQQIRKIDEYTLFPSTVKVILQLFYSYDYCEDYNRMTLAIMKSTDDLDMGKTLTVESSTGGAEKFWLARMRYKEDSGDWKEKIISARYSADGTYMGIS